MTAIADHVAKKNIKQLLINELLLGAPLHALQWGETGGGAYILGEKVTNGEFDYNTNGWTALGSTLASVAGGKIGNCLRITNTAPNGNAYQIFDVDEETEYVIEGYIQQGTATGGRVRMIDPDQGNLIQLVEDITADATWQRFKYYFTTDVGQTRVGIDLHNQGGGVGTTILYDRISVQENRRIPFVESEIVNVTIDNADGYEVFSISDVDLQPSTADGFRWYCEETGDRVRLYVHTFDRDDPATLLSGDIAKYCVSADFWLGFCNQARSKVPDNPVIYEREESVWTNPTLDRWDTSGADVLIDWNLSANASRDSTVVAHDLSAYSANCTIAGAAIQYIDRNARMKPRRKYKVSCWYWFNSSGNPQIRVYDTGTNVYLQDDSTWSTAVAQIPLPSIPALEEQWNYFEIEFTSHEDYEDYTFRFQNNSLINGGIVRFDDCYLWRIRQPLQYHAFLHASSIPSVYQAVGDYYQIDTRFEFGSVNYNNNGFFYERKNLYLWHNRKAQIKFGEFGSNYSDLETVFTAATRRPAFGDAYCVIDHIDIRVSDLAKIPNRRYTLAETPNMDASFANKVKPVLMGEKTDITPVYIGQIGGQWAEHFTDTTFNGDSFPANSVVEVRKDGITLATPADYNVNLNLGYIRLTADPLNSEIRIDAQGVVVDFEDGSYSTNVADFIYFILVELNGVDPDEVNIKYLLSLKTNRTQQVAEHLKEDEESIEVTKRLMRSATFHCFPLASGKYITRYFDPVVPDDTPQFKNEDIKSFKEIEETDQCFKEVVIQYDKNPSTGVWLEAFSSKECVESLQRIKQRLILQTSLVNSAEAETLADFFLDLVESPPDKLHSTIDTKALLIDPTFLGIFSYTRRGDDGFEFNILEDDVYRLLELTKNLHTAETIAVGTKSMQAAGVSRHVDVTHADHSDSVHGDTAHVDVPHADHTDGGFLDHSDSPHTDTPHIDTHTDLHTDVPHSDSYF